MSDSRYSHNDRDAPNDPAKEMFREMDRALKTSLREGYKGEPETFLGMEVDPMLSGVISTAYNMGTKWATKSWLGDYIYSTTMRMLSPQLQSGQMQHGTASRVASATTFGASLLLKSGKYITPIFNTFFWEPKTKYEELAKKIAPVLDELKGSHSLLSLMRVGITDNEMIYAHRQRLAKIVHNKQMGSFWDFAINVVPNSISDVLLFRGTWSKRTSPQMLRNSDPRYQQKQQQQHTQQGVPTTPEDMLDYGVNLFTGPLAEAMKAKNAKKLSESLSGQSALEMVLALEEEILNDPKKQMFYPSPQSKQGMTLEDYIMQVMIHHQEDMVKLNPAYSPIRKEMREDLALVAKPLAKAIRSGEINALALVRLIGEGHIIKAQGRVISSVEEVEALVERSCSKSEHKLHQNPKDYYGTSSFTRDDLKATLKVLEGNERLLVASWFSDAMLEDAGLEPKEIKDIREATCAHYEQMLLEELSGVIAKSDEELKREEMPVAEIRKVREAQKKLECGGEKAIHELRESPANPHGVERLLANLVIPKMVVGDREYLGRLVAVGRERLATQDNGHQGSGIRDQKKPAESAQHDDSYVKNAADHGHKDHENVRDLHRSTNDNHPKHHISGKPQHQGVVQERGRHVAGA